MLPQVLLFILTESVHLKLLRIIYKRTRYAQMVGMITGKDRVMRVNLWQVF